MPSQLSDIVKIATVDRSLRKVLTKDLGDPLAHDFGASAAFQKDCFGDHCFEHTYHGIKKKTPRTRNCSHKSAFWNLHGGPGCPADPAEVVS